MHLQDHDIVVEDRGILFRARITAGALDMLELQAVAPRAAEALVADYRAALEQLAIASYRMRPGDGGSMPVLIGVEDVRRIEIFSAIGTVDRKG